MSEKQGIPYTVLEARMAANDHKNMDIYHKELILFLCNRVELLEKEIRKLTTKEVIK